MTGGVVMGTEQTVLFAWLGHSDIKAAKEATLTDPGPIGLSFQYVRPDRLLVLSSQSEKDNLCAYDWLRRVTGQAIELVSYPLKNPTDYEGIYSYTLDAVKKKAGRDNCSFVFNISSGTPAMCTVWILLANSQYPARLVKTSIENGAEDVHLPFRIGSEFLPRLQKQRSRDISRLIAGESVQVNISFNHITAISEKIQKLKQDATVLAFHDVPVLILGETGTGKEIWATAIHQASGRSKKEPVMFNCAAITASLAESELFGHAKGGFTGASTDRDGLVKQADGGTLFLDEIGELSADIQAKLLRVLQQKTFRKVGGEREEKSDFRLIAATNRDLQLEVAAGRFRQDLFQRIAVGVLKLPALRDRQAELPVMAEEYLAAFNKRAASVPGYIPKILSSDAVEMIRKHTWPGNIRELQNSISRAAIWCRTELLNAEDIRNALLQGEIECCYKNLYERKLGDGFSLDKLISEITGDYLARALKEADGNQEKAARLLGFKSGQTFSNRLKKCRKS
jgi:DNA-binding NtrC family response regulator